MDFREHADFPAYEARGREAARAGGYTGQEADDFADDYAIGAMGERERCAAILTSRAAADRPAAARHLAVETDMSADAAIALLGTLPADTRTISGPRASTSPFGLVMTREGTGGARGSMVPDTAAIYAARAAACTNPVTGAPPKKPAEAAALPDAGDVYARRRGG